MLRWVVNVLFVESTTGVGDSLGLGNARLVKAPQVPVGDAMENITNNITNKYKVCTPPGT